VPSDRYPFSENATERLLREARQRFVALQPSAAQRAVRDALDSPVQQAIKEVVDSPVQRAISDATQARERLLYGTHSSRALPHATSTAPQHPITSAADLAPFVRKARKRMKMTQQQFADACGVGRRFLSELENGKSSLEFDKVLKCALGAGIDLLVKPRIPL
jgi:y4mF family transcriptional regulator